MKKRSVVTLLIVGFMLVTLSLACKALAEEKQIKLKPGEVKDVTLEVSIPEGSQPRNNRWENIILVKPDEGLTGFVRVWVEMIEE